MGRDLVSKLLAAGLSAGVFLIWWPEHHASSGLVSLVMRGALWTLSFELLLLAFAPLERLVRRAAAARLREPLLRSRLAGVPAGARVGGACALACVGAALPVALLAGSHVPRPHRAAARTERVVVVKRRVERRRVVVRQVVTVPAVVAHPEPVAWSSRTTRRPTAAKRTKRASVTTEPAPAQRTPAQQPATTPPTPAPEPTPATTTETAPAAASTPGG